MIPQAYVNPLRVLVAGHGTLGDSVAAELRRFAGTSVIVSGAEAAREDLADADVVACCADEPTVLMGILASSCREAGVPLVVGQLTGDGGAIAPVLAGHPPGSLLGCPVCAECHAADRDPLAAARPSLPAAPADVAVVAQLVVLALCKALEITRGTRPADAQTTLVDFRRRTVSAETVAPHPRCGVCFPPTAPEAVTPPAAQSELDARLPRLRSLTGDRFGLFEPTLPRAPRERQAVWRFFRERGVDPRRTLLANAHLVEVRRHEVRGSATARIASDGFDFTHAGRAEAIALIEGLERLSALAWCPPQRLVEASYREVAADALDPRHFPLYAESQYQEPGFPLRRFEPGERIAWTRGVDITAGDRPVLVPADLVFASRSPMPIYPANSNGAACHGDRTRAILNGIYETVERDALMIAWLNRLSLPRVNFDAADPDPWSMRGTLASLDFDLAHVDITTDLGIPVLLGVLRDRRNPALLLMDMVSHLDPRSRLDKLYRELAQFLFPYLVDRDHFVRPCTHDPDPDSVKTFADHVAFHQDAEKNRHAAFLASAGTSRQFADDTRAATAREPQAELPWLVARLAERGHRVIVVDCTLPLLRDLGLFAVKVLVPGLQPLNCGHRLRALGGERVVTVAQRMGLATGRRSLAELNPWPHPFW